ncbi:FG-GAP repeat domain-containing protein [Clostridium sp. JNZ J1-5]
MTILKLRVLFLRKKYIYYFLLILIVFTFFIISYVSGNNSSPIFNVNQNERFYKSDLTGDGKEDILYITTNKDRYYLQVNTQKDSLYLEPNNKSSNMGIYSPFWPMRVKLLDISRDSVPEIFTQSSQNNTPIQHIFKYDSIDNKFKDVFCSYNNVLGFIDCTNNQTPKIISGSIYQGNFAFANYILIGNKLERYNRKASDTFMGKDTILYFINLITTLTSEYVQTSENIFDPKINSNSLSVLYNLSNSGKNYIFQDALFMDTKSNKNGEPIQIQWILNFRGNSIKSEGEVKNFTLKVNLKAFDDSKEKYHFKIYSISLT